MIQLMSDEKTLLTTDSDSMIRVKPGDEKDTEKSFPKRKA